MPRRRPQGGGTLCYDKQRKRWICILDLGTVNGKRVRRKVSAPTQREALDKLDALKRQYAAGVSVTGGQQTLATFLERWLNETVRETLKPKTHGDYERLVRLYIVPYLGRHKLEALTPEHVQVMIRQMREEGRGKRTIQQTHMVLRSALNQAVAWSYVLRNVAELVKPPSPPKPKIHPLTKDEAARLIRVAAETNDRHEILYRVALRLGLRRGEIIALRWEDVAMDTCTVTIRTGKTAASARTIQVPASLIAHLKRQHERVAQLRRAQGKNWREHQLVFPSEVGTPLSGSSLTSRDFKRSLKNAGIQPISFHNLRHTCATLLLSEGVPLLIVSRTLGHASVQITLDVYGHVLPDDQREQLSRLDSLLG